MTFGDIIRYAFILVAAISSIAILFSRNVFHAALFLLTCLLAVAAIYVLAFAEFVAVVQILIYAGGVLVIILFGIMLTTRLTGKALVVGNNNVFSGTLVVCIVLFMLSYFIYGTFLSTADTYVWNERHIETIGINLLTSHALPFELSAIILLVALVGAAVTAQETTKTNIDDAS